MDNNLPTRPPTQHHGYSENSELTVLLAKILTLVAPTSMTTEQQELWLRAAIDALQGIRAAEVRSIILELQRSATRPNQIVPEIARLVAEKRRMATSGPRRPKTALEWAEGAKERNLPQHSEAWMQEARRRGEIA